MPTVDRKAESQEAYWKSTYRLKEILKTYTHENEAEQTRGHISYNSSPIPRCVQSRLVFQSSRCSKFGGGQGERDDL